MTTTPPPYEPAQSSYQTTPAPPQPQSYQTQTAAQRPSLPTSMAHTNAFAVIAVILAFVQPIAGIVFGHMALGQIKRNGDSGRGLALTGLIIGYIYVAFIVVFVVFYVSMLALLIGTAGSMFSDFSSYDSLESF